MVETTKKPATPEVTKLTGDIWNRMTPSERDQLGIKAGLDAEERDSRWIELWPEKKRAVIREFKKEQATTPKAPVTPEPKVERGKAKLAITEVLKNRREITGKHWEESKKEQLQRIANMVDGVAQKHNVPKSVLLKSLAITPTYSELRSKHTSRSSLAQASDERQKHKVTISPDSPRVKQWITDQGTADISGIDTPPISKRSSLGRKGTQRITPKTPKLRR